jgi:hypothetical protein
MKTEFEVGSLRAHVEPNRLGNELNVTLKYKSGANLLPSQALSKKPEKIFTDDFRDLLKVVLEEFFPENGKSEFEFATLYFGGNKRNKELEDLFFPFIVRSDFIDYFGVLKFENISNLD